MHDYDVHKVLNLNCEIHGPWIRGLGPKVGHVSEN